ncbi:transient receptor potential cation channel subfamily M member 2-like [Symsagittifera roscoffensis]|uniref:transient receptor potential cation channel subfamily M member 2-like n=1 Tax=Symsagittifera roscoffensis TaxID=84072 RepID=UPI00307BC33C
MENTEVPTNENNENSEKQDKVFGDEQNEAGPEISSSSQNTNAVLGTGIVRFTNGEQNEGGPPFMRVNANAKGDEDISDLVEQIQNSAWNLSKPSLIISVTGGASDFKMKKKDHEKLRQGLQRVLDTKGAWLISGGTNKGIMKICGEAVRDNVLSKLTASDSRNQTVAIGIATWGAVSKEELIFTQPLDPDKAYDPDEHMETSLDPNHSHFILVDDGSRGEFGREQEVRGLVEKKLCDNGVGDEQILSKEGKFLKFHNYLEYTISKKKLLI